MTEHIVARVVARGITRDRNFRPSGSLLILAVLAAASASAERPCAPQLTAEGGDTVVSGGQVCPTDSVARTDTPDYQDPIASCSGLAERRVVQVSTASALQQAMANASCGDTIQLAPGTYGATFSISKTCSATSPIIIKGAPDFTSTISNTFTVSGARNIVTGIRFAGPDARVTLGGTNNRLLANKFTGWRGIAIGPVAGSYGEIAYNECFSPAAWDADTGKTQFRMCIRMHTGGNGESASVHKHAWVHHNWFHDLPAKPNPDVFASGQSDAIEAGESNYDWTPTLLSGWYIENNLIERHGQSQNAVVDLKVGGTVARYNTVRGVDNGRIDIRFGSNTTVESNWFEKGGTFVHGGAHKVVCNNYGSGVGMRVLAGNVEWDSGENKHPRSMKVLTARNKGPLRVGYQAITSQTLPAQDTTVEDNGGSISYGLHSGTTIKSSSAVNCAEPTPLSSTDVGPAALTQASTSYLACRIP